MLKMNDGKFKSIETEAPASFAFLASAAFFASSQAGLGAAAKAAEAHRAVVKQSDATNAMNKFRVISLILPS